MLHIRLRDIGTNDRQGTSAEAWTVMTAQSSVSGKARTITDLDARDEAIEDTPPPQRPLPERPR
jgi:hypothetical protein